MCKALIVNYFKYVKNLFYMSFVKLLQVGVRAEKKSNYTSE